MSDEDPKAGLKQLALDSSEMAIHWRRRFTLLAWFNVGIGVLWLAVGVLFVLASRVFLVLGGLVLFGLGIFALKHAHSIFREARNAYARYMQIRQECLHAIDIRER